MGVYHQAGDDGGDFLLDGVHLSSGGRAFEVHHGGAPTARGFVHVLDSTFESDGAWIGVNHAEAGEPVEIGFLNVTFDLDWRGVEINGNQEADLLVLVGRTTFRGGREAQLRVVDHTSAGAATGVVENVFEHGNGAIRNTGVWVGRLRDIAGTYTGLIDDVRVYDVALSSEEVAGLYALESTVCP